MKLRLCFSIASVAGLVLALGFSSCAKKSAEASAAGGAAAPAKLAALPVIGPAPVWRLKDVNGQVVDSAQFKGKVVVIDFWATWCGPCRMEIPGYAELQRKYGKDGLVIIGVSLDEGGPEVVKPFMAKFQINYPIVMGDDTVQAAFGGMEAIPTTFLIDREGRVRDRKQGAEPTETYEQKVLAVLKG
jgi:thiol-disulfide isomerase/thioredoxin